MGKKYGAKRIRGAINLRRAIKELPDQVRAAAWEEVQEVARKVHQEGLENMNAMGIKDHTGEVRHRSRGSLDLGQRLIAEARGSGAPTEKGGNLRKWYKIYKSERSLVAHVGYRGKAGREAAWYAHFVHYGTDRQEAKPFHRNAVISHIDAFRSQTQAAYKRAIDANLRKFTRQAGYSKKSRRK